MRYCKHRMSNIIFISTILLLNSLNVTISHASDQRNAIISPALRSYKVGTIDADASYINVEYSHAEDLPENCYLVVSDDHSRMGTHPNLLHHGVNTISAKLLRNANIKEAYTTEEIRIKVYCNVYARGRSSSRYLYNNVVPIHIEWHKQGKPKKTVHNAPSYMSGLSQRYSTTYALKHPGQALPSSYWIENQAHRYTELLKKGQYDTLVVPFQSGVKAVDDIARRVMTRSLAHEIATRSKYKIPDIDSVIYALGSNTRYLEFSSIAKLAKALNVDRIITGDVGHDGMSNMTIRVKIATLNHNTNVAYYDNKRLQPKVIDNIKISETVSPELAYLSVQDQILEYLGIDADKPKKEVKNDSVQVKLPEDPFQLYTATGNTVNDIYRLQTAGMLAPVSSYSEYREKLFERSLVLAQQLPSTIGARRALMARALFYLHRRPSALELLGGSPESNEEKALIALMDGNMPELKKINQSESNDMISMMNMIGLVALYFSYGKLDTFEGDIIEILKKYPGYALYLYKRFYENDAWKNDNNLEVRNILDQSFPMNGSSLEQELVGKNILGADSGNNDLELSAPRYIRKYFDDKSDTVSTAGLREHLTALDYLELLDSLVDENTVKKVLVLSNSKRLPEQAIDYYKSVESIYKGHPEVVRFINTAYKNIKAGKTQDEANNIQHIIDDNVAILAQYVDGQSQLLGDAYNEKYSDFVNDIPPREEFAYERELFGKPNVLVSNDFTQDNPGYLIRYFKKTLEKGNENNGSSNDFEKLYAQNLHRFIGSPKRLELQEALYRLRKKEIPDSVYENAIKKDPYEWNYYRKLGKILIKKNKLNDVYELLASHPDLKEKETRTSPITLSHRVGDAGNIFFWRGSLQKAKHFYEYAKNLDTYSQSELQSLYRLGLLNGDLQSSADYLIKIVRRYNSEYRISDLIALYGATGYSDRAQMIVKASAKSFPNHVIWQGFDISQSTAGVSTHDSYEWIKHNLPDSDRRYVEDYLTFSIIQDGNPDEASLADMKSIQKNISLFNYIGCEDYSRFKQQMSGNDFTSNMRKIYEDQLKHVAANYFTDEPVDCENIPIQSKNTQLVNAYSRLLDKQYGKAKRLFKAALTMYESAKEDALPYYAYALIRDNDSSGIQQLEGWLDNAIKNYVDSESAFCMCTEPLLGEYYLAKGVLEAHKKHYDKSIDLIKHGFNVAPYTLHGVISNQYKVLEIAEWLYQDTRKDLYKDYILTLSKKLQNVQPWISWLYAFQARYDTSREEKLKALKMLQYLDPLSRRLSTMNKKDLKDARKISDLNNIFIQNKQVEGDSAI